MRRTPTSSWTRPLAFLAASLAGLHAWAQQTPGTTPAAAPAPENDPGTLARFVPAEKLLFYMEFQGLDSYPEAWKKTAASKILTETKTGEMLAEILTQLAEQGLANIPGRKLTGADLTALIEHAFNKGFVVGGFGTAAAPSGFVLVLRDALNPEAGPIVGRFLATTGLANPNAKAVSRPDGRRVVQFVPNNPEIGWWVEGKKDLIVTSSVSAVTQAAAGESANALKNGDREALIKAEGGFQPVGLLFFDVPTASLPPQAARLGLDGLKKVQYRWGFEDKALRSEWRIVAPAPRSGLLALADQPSFGLADIPQLPEGVDNFVVLSIDPAALYEQAIALSKAVPSGVGGGAASGEGIEGQLEAFEKAFRDKTRKDFRKDVLSQIGPKVILYVLPEKKSGSGSTLASLNPLNGLQVPKSVLMMELKDPKKFGGTMTELVKVINKSLEPPAPPPSGGGNGNTPRPGQGGTNKPAQPPGFRLSTSNPPTWILNMPLLNTLGVRPTVAVGKKHLVVATAPDLVKAALAVDGKEGSWSPSGEASEAVAGLPEKMIFLAVTDPRGSLPQALADLPDQIQKGLAAAALGGGALPGMSPPAAPGGDPGAAPGAGGVGEPEEGGQVTGIRTRGGGVALRPEFQREGTGPGQSGSPPQAPGGVPGAAGSPMAGPLSALAKIKIDVPADKRPDPKEIEKLLFPGSTALVVDDQGLTITSRQAFFDIGTSGSFGGITAALTLPAVQSARAAALPSAGGAGAAPPVAPPGAAGAQGIPTPGVEAVPGGGATPGPGGRRRGPD